MDLLKGEHLTEEYFGINPNGVVPTLVHDGVVIIESQDIIDYLDHTFPNPPLRLDGPKEREVMKEWMRRSGEIHVKAVKTYIYDKKIRYGMKKTEEEQERYKKLQTNKELLEFHKKSSENSFSDSELQRAEKTLHECFSEANELLDQHEWLAGDRFSLADIAWVPLYFTLDKLAKFPFEDYPNVASWAQKIEDRPSFKKAVLNWWPSQQLNEVKDIEQVERSKNMLELYHHGSSVCAAKVRYGLGIKGVVPDEMHYIDILKGEQFTPEYKAINPKAVVPALVHNDTIINESTLICEYVNDVFDGPNLIPTDAYGRVQMRMWTKAVDEQLHPACGELTFVCCHRHIVMRLGKEKLEEFLKSTPDQSVTNKWKARKQEIVREGFDAPGIGDTIKLYDGYLAKMEEALSKHEWLAGDEFTLADVALAPYVNRLDMLSMSGLWTGGRFPRVEAWFNKINKTDTFKEAFLDWCPEELTNDLKTFGAQSWPEVRQIVGID